MKKYKIGIALGGGGSRGFAHLGVLQALNEKCIFPDIISGTSAGAIVGVLYAAGNTPMEIYGFMKNKKFTDFSKMHLPINGLFSLDSLKDTLKEGIDVEDLKDLKIPFYACVSNLHTGKVEYLNCGPLYKIIQASSSIPIVFSPVEINKQVYVDGGLMDNLPVRPLVRQCEKIIGVNIFPDKETEKIDNLLKVATRIFQISLNSNIKYNKSKCHLYIEPEAISKYHMLETKFNEQIFEIGYKFCKNVKLKQLM